MEDRKRWTRLFWALAAAHVAVWLTVCVLTQPNATLDTAEMLFWGREWEWGYHKHPPLPAWIAAIGSAASGGHVWGAYLAGQLAVVACFWSAWRMGREVLSPGLALLAAALLECSVFYTYLNMEIDNTIIGRAPWALSILFFYWAMKSDRVGWWMMAGLMLGLAMLSKYYAAYLAVSIAGFGLVNREARRHWLRPGPYACLLTATAVFIPHVIWMFHHDFTTLHYALQRSSGTGSMLNHVVYPLRFALAQGWYLLPACIVILPLTGLRWRLREIGPHERFARDFLAAAVLAPPVLFLLTSLVLGVKLRSLWGGALWTMAGVVLLFCLELRSGPLARRRAAVGWAIVVGILVLVSTARNVAAPMIAGKPSRIHFPGRHLAQQVNEAWHKRYHTSLPIVGGDWWLATNAALYSPDCVRVYGDLSTRVSPWLSDDELRRTGGVVVWDAGTNVPGIPVEVRQRFPTAQLLPMLKLRWQTPADLEPLAVGAALVPPGSAVRSPPVAHKPRSRRPG